MTIDSTFLIFISLVGFALMIFGHLSKIRIFNLLSVLVFIFLAIQLNEMVILLLLFIGLGLYEIWFTFMGGE